MFRNALSGTIQLADLPEKIEGVYFYGNQLTGSLELDRLPAAVRTLNLSGNKFTANPTKGHLSVVGWTSTQPLGRFGKPPNYFQGENLLGGETREDIY